MKLEFYFKEPKDETIASLSFLIIFFGLGFLAVFNIISVWIWLISGCIPLAISKIGYLHIRKIKDKKRNK